MSNTLKGNYNTPAGQLIWNYVFEPDTGGKFSDDKYKQTIRLYDDEATELIKKFDGMKAEAADILEVKPSDIKQLPFKKATDAEGKVIEGAYDFIFKTKQAPMVVDAKKNKLTKGHIPGYRIRQALGKGVILFKPHAYQVSGSAGIGAYLQVVQILELREGGVDLDMLADYEDGFTAEAGEAMDTPVYEEDDDAIPSFAS